MNKKDYIITRSNYTVRKKHQSFSNGATVYERDFMTTDNYGGFEGATFPLSYGGFKFTKNPTNRYTRKHKYGEWLKPTGQESEFWTVNSFRNDFTVSQESKIQIKPNYNSLLDFAYYGSCTELIRTTIEHIIKTFPGEIYVSKNEKIISGETYYIVENPFQIDIFSKVLPNNEDVNPLRFMCESYGRYEIMVGTECEHGGCVDDWYSEGDGICIQDNNFGRTAFLGKFNMNKEGVITPYELYIKEYNDNGKYILLADIVSINNGASFAEELHIRPVIEDTETFFENLDDFEKMVLNRDSNPLYTMHLDAPFETENGTFTRKRHFTWPVLHGWNLDIESMIYEMYIENLAKLASYYDAHYTNNMWRMITHDAIKNFDRTYEVESRKDETVDDVKIGIGKMEGFLMSCGRLFDDIKRYIDNIKNANTVTYNQVSNLPDYFLSDTLQNKGWEVYSAVERLDLNAVLSSLYPGSNKKYMSPDVNLTFLRNLCINSTRILKGKGTHESVEMILGLFGMKSYNAVKGNTFRYKWEDGESFNFFDIPKVDGKRVEYETEEVDIDELSADEKGKVYDYILEESVAVAKSEGKEEDLGPVSEDMTLNVERYNAMKNVYDGDGDEEDTLIGIPAKMVYLETVDDEGEPITFKYVIPWAKKSKNLDGETYFQMYGGWGKRLSKDINNSLAPNVKKIISDDGFSIYSETKKYISVVRTVSELMDIEVSDLNDGDIFYVYSMDDFDMHFDATVNEPSNYFILRKAPSDTTKGDEYEYGEWENIPLDDIRNANGDGVKVLYIESLIDEKRGNNPHIGYGRYDGGKEYIENFRHLFKQAIKSDIMSETAYDCETGKILDEIDNAGFDVELEIDSAKCWYFTDRLMDDKKVYRLVESRVSGKTSSNCTYVSDTIYKESGETVDTQVGLDSDGHFPSKMVPYNFESGGTNDVAASYSVINTKNLKIKFVGRYTTDDNFVNFVNYCIIPYLMQVIPSTTILEIEIEGENAVYQCMNIAQVMGVSGEEQYIGKFEETNCCTIKDEAKEEYHVDITCKQECENKEQNK